MYGSEGVLEPHGPAGAEACGFPPGHLWPGPAVLLQQIRFPSLHVPI